MDDAKRGSKMVIVSAKSVSPRKATVPPRKAAPPRKNSTTFWLLVLTSSLMVGLQLRSLSPIDDFEAKENRRAVLRRKQQSNVDAARSKKATVLSAKVVQDPKFSPPAKVVTTPISKLGSNAAPQFAPIPVSGVVHRSASIPISGVSIPVSGLRSASIPVSGVNVEEGRKEAPSPEGTAASIAGKASPIPPSTSSLSLINSYRSASIPVSGVNVEGEGSEEPASEGNPALSSIATSASKAFSELEGSQLDDSTMTSPSNLTLVGSSTTQPESNTNNLWFLHIPKTGSTFIRDMIQHACPTQSAEDILEIFNLILEDKHRKRFPCAASIKPGHLGLKASADLSRTVTMVRNPFDRVVSGFLHNLHDCPRLQKLRAISDHDDPAVAMEEICRDIRDVVHDPKTGDPDWVEKRLGVKNVVKNYMKCVRGCSRNMLLGGDKCKHSKKEFDDADAELNRRLTSLPYVGVTDEWTKSLCLWRRAFPAREGGTNGYLSDAEYGSSAQFRKTPLHDCQEDLKKLIKSDQSLSAVIADDPDWAVYDKSIELLEERLPPECRED